MIFPPKIIMLKSSYYKDMIKYILHMDVTLQFPLYYHTVSIIPGGCSQVPLSHDAAVGYQKQRKQCCSVVTSS